MKKKYLPIPTPSPSVLKALFTLVCFITVSFNTIGQDQTKKYYQTKLKANTTIGYLSYLPPAYKTNNEDFPLLVFLHGLGEIGSNLDDLFHYGPPQLIKYGKWPADRPFVVISPQTPSVFGGTWNIDLIDEIIDKIVAEYRIDESRIYLTGTSLGGNGTWRYATAHPERVAAVVPICGWGQPNLACNMKNVPTWAFHNEGDGVVNVSGTKNMINALNACPANPKPKQTIYPQSGHNAWSKTYDLSAGHDIYSWLLSHSKSGVQKPEPTNNAPVANAGSDKTLTLPQNSITLTGSGVDSDGQISSYKWAKVNGPSATMQNASTQKLTLSNLVEGTYTFRLTVTDDKLATGINDAIVRVLPGVSSGSTVAYSYYEGSWTVLPDFSKLTPKKTGTTDNFTLSPRNRNDNFAFQFKSYIDLPADGDYTFYTSSDDGSKLYIDNKLVVNNDGLHGKKEISGRLNLSKGTHLITVSYFERSGGEVLEVRYSGPGISKQLVPKSVLKENGTVPPPPAEDPSVPSEGLSYAYYEGIWDKLPDFSSLTPKKTGIVSEFDLSPAISDSYFALSFEGTIQVPQSGEYTFYTTSDDGSKLYINNQEVVNNDLTHAKQERSGKISLTAGTHNIKVTYFEKAGGEILQVHYSGPGISKRLISSTALASQEQAAPAPTTSLQNGLSYKYYEGSWDKLPDYNQLDPKKTGTVANFSLSPATSTDYFGFTFDGQIKIAASGYYTFSIRSDDGSKLYIDGKEIINNDGLHASQEVSGKVNLSAGMLSIKVAYFEKAGGETLKVYYQGPGVSKQIIPANVLFHSSTNTQSMETMGIAKDMEQKPESFMESESTKAYPNPFTDQLNVAISGEYEGFVSVLLMDLQGKEIFNQQIDSKAMYGPIDIPTSNLTKGIYLLQITNGAKKEVVKVIKN